MIEQAAAAHEALLAEAREDARRELASADADVQAALEHANAQAAEVLARARAQGEAEGRAAAVRDVAQARVLARMRVQAARRESYEELRRRARARVLALRDEPGYPALLDRLAAAARVALGPGAQLETDPAGEGGVRAQAGTRRVDLTLPALADRCLNDHGAAAARLWE